jgi:hypothetical protein
MLERSSRHEILRRAALAEVFDEINLVANLFGDRTAFA